MAIPFYRRLYFYVLLAILAGIVTGILFPATATSFKILSDLFLRLIKMIIGPVVFLTVTLGIGSMTDLKKAGRIGLKAILYFEVVTTFALAIGLIVVNLIRPGEGMNIDPALLDTSLIGHFNVSEKKSGGLYSFFDTVIPRNIIQPFAEENILQILLLSVLTGTALALTGDTGKKLRDFLKT